MLISRWVSYGSFFISPCRYDDITRIIEDLKLNSCEGIALFVYLDNLNPCGQLFVGDG